MPRKVSEEMSCAERCDRMIHGMKATGAEEVAVNFSHLAHALNSVDAAEKFADNLTEMQGLVPTTMKKKAKLVKQGLCTVDRQVVLEALLKKKEEYAKTKIDKNVK